MNIGAKRYHALYCIAVVFKRLSLILQSLSLPNFPLNNGIYVHVS